MCREIEGLGRIIFCASLPMHLARVRVLKRNPPNSIISFNKMHLARVRVLKQYYNQPLQVLCDAFSPCEGIETLQIH